MNNNTENIKKERVITGVAGSPGIVEGRLFVIRRNRIPIQRESIPVSDIDKEIRRFRSAVAESIAEVSKLKKEISNKLGEEVSEILDVQIMLLDDKELNRRVVSRIRDEGVNAEYVYDGEMRKVTDSLEKAGSDYLRQRQIDIKALKAKVLANLRGVKHHTLAGLDKPRIVAAKSFSVGEVAQMLEKNVTGIITAAGGATSHTAILAKSANIPAVLGIDDQIRFLDDDMELILDGHRGKAILNPSRETKEIYGNRILSYSREREQLLVERDEPASTLDGRRISLLANIELVSEVDQALSVGAEGIGLYRSEFMYFTHGGLPSEDQQYKIYKTIAEKMAPRPVTIRTFDLGGDKFVEDNYRPYEVNPFLGWRAIRISLALKDYFKAQLRAILRASTHGNVSIMLPMICDHAEIVAAREVFECVKKDLSGEGVAYNPDTKFGIMIEVPSAAINARSFTGLVDFFSIGTNDLTQYTLAVDRGNEVVGHLFQCFHPAVIRLTSMAITAANDAHIPVSVCGEMAGDPLATMLLIGLGADALSAPYSSLPQVKNIIRNITFADAEKISVKALEMETTTELRNVLANFLVDHFEGSSCPI